MNDVVGNDVGGGDAGAKGSDRSAAAPDGPAAVIRATYELEPAGSAEALVAEVCLGQPEGPASVRGRVLAESESRAVVELPAGNWTADLTMVLTALAGEVLETAQFSRCRLVAVELPPGWLPGPAVGAWGGVAVGVIVKPSLGLGPAEVAAVAERCADGGARLVKDDELLGDPPWCPLLARVRAVADRLSPGVVYAANVSGSHDGLLGRARRAVEAGAGALMVNVGTQGLDAVRALRAAGLGVPLLAHRVGTGGLTRNDRFGLSLPVLAQLTRLAGADLVLCGAFGGKLHDSDEEVSAQADACRRPLPGGPRAATALLGGGVGPERVVGLLDQVVHRLGSPPDGLVLLCGQAAYRHPGGVAGGVAATVRAVEQARVR